MKEFTGYQCEHCGKLYKSKYHCQNHEENKCTHNPKNWDACIQCNFSFEYNEEIEFDSEHPYYGYAVKATRTVKKYGCKKLNKELYPFKCKSKGWVKKYPKSFKNAEQMPNTCEHYESDYINPFTYEEGTEINKIED